MENCPICFESIKTKQQAIMTSCGHKFHKMCMRDPYSCPMCRKVLLPTIYRTGYNNYNRLSELIGKYDIKTNSRPLREFIKENFNVAHYNEFFALLNSLIKKDFYRQTKHSQALETQNYRNTINRLHAIIEHYFYVPHPKNKQRLSRELNYVYNKNI